MSKEIALDLRRYNTPDKLGSLVSDTASLAIEASETGISRINPHFFIKKNNDYVIAPGRDKRDVLEMFVNDAGDPSTQAAKEIRRLLIGDKTNSAYVWISSPDEWPEARLEIGVKKITKSEKFEYLKCYGVSSSLTGERCLSLGQFLVSISSETIGFPQNTDDLRKTIIKLNIPEDQDPFVYLSKLIELPEKDSWINILNGQVDKNKANAIKAAVTATEPVINSPYVIYSNPIGYGSYVENRMKYLGYEMNPKKFGCGISNNDAQTNYYSTTTEFSGYEYPNETKTWSYHIGDCVYPGCTRTGVEVGPCNICKICEAKP